MKIHDLVSFRIGIDRRVAFGVSDHCIATSEAQLSGEELPDVALKDDEDAGPFLRALRALDTRSPLYRAILRITVLEDQVAELRRLIEDIK